MLMGIGRCGMRAFRGEYHVIPGRYVVGEGEVKDIVVGEMVGHRDGSDV